MSEYHTLFAQIAGQTSTEIRDAIFQPCFLSGPHVAHLLCALTQQTI